MKEILKVDENNSESQIVIKAAKYGNYVSNVAKYKFSGNLVFKMIRFSVKIPPSALL